MKGRRYTTTLKLVVLTTHMMMEIHMSAHLGPGERKVYGSIFLVWQMM